ncbi:AAA family ATPase [Jiella pacifica]|uniref:AAA family ATPase n=1 Tax=Jiella pacifica TaxID=2696469 RepID=A0A6N9T0B9_9HYPH|nr:AAA family ATPase [Jiella pacifica]NDW04780.1 AAA family ATPase [Jiella pacifica]
MKQAIIVNGVPASGKSTVGAHLTRALLDAGLAAVPLGLDVVKEALFVEVGIGDREHNRMLGRASYRAIFDTIAGFSSELLPVIDAWHGFQPQSVLKDHLARSGIERVVEIWCAVSPETAAGRYRARTGTRHAGHLPAAYADELFELTKRARPMALGPVVEIDTERPWQPGITARVRELLEQDGYVPTASASSDPITE